MPKLSLARLTGIYLRVGNLTFGGGDPTMAALQNELVVRHGWLTPEKYALTYALARITPGTNVLAFCAGSGWYILGWRGAAAAVLAASLPSAIFTVLLTAGYDAARASRLAMAAVGGTLAAAVGLMATGAWLLLSGHLTARHLARAARAVCFAGAAFALAYGFRLSPITVLALAAVAGSFWQGPRQA